MTGAAVVDSPHAFQMIRDLFVELYLHPQDGKLPSHNMKLVWQSLAVCRAALEIHHGDKMSGKQIHIKMWDKYMSWSNIICDEDDCGMKINEKPNYLSKQWFMTSDAKHKKPYVEGAVTGKKFWKKWGTVKSSIINSDNLVVKRTIASMPGGALPSGTDWGLFLTRLIYNLYMEKEKMKPKKADTDDDKKADTDNDNNYGNEAGIDEIGGSVAKKAGLSMYCADEPDPKDNSEGSVGSHGVGSHGSGNDANDESEPNNSGECHNDDDDDDDEHDEPTAPDTFFPATLLVVLTIGVLSDECDTMLNHAVDRGEVDESNLVTVPSRAQCRESAVLDLPSAASVASGVSTPSSLPLSIERLKARAAYNEAYKEVNNKKNELGTKRLKVLEDELDIKRKEVQARQDEVKLAGLAALYKDLRQDLSDAKESGDADDIRNIKMEMMLVQKQRRELMVTSTVPE